MDAVNSDTAAFEPTVSPLARSLVTVGSLLAALLLVSVPAAALLGVGGAVIWAVAVRRRSRQALDVGAGLFALALLTAGIGSASMPRLVAATAIAFVSYDLAATGLSLATAIGRRGETRTAVLARLGVTSITAAVTAGVGYLAFSVATDAIPPATIALVFGGVLLAALALR